MFFYIFHFIFFSTDDYVSSTYCNNFSSFKTLQVSQIKSSYNMVFCMNMYSYTYQPIALRLAVGILSTRASEHVIMVVANVCEYVYVCDNKLATPPRQPVAKMNHRHHSSWLTVIKSRYISSTDYYVYMSRGTEKPLSSRLLLPPNTLVQICSYILWFMKKITLLHT